MIKIAHFTKTSLTNSKLMDQFMGYAGAIPEIMKERARVAGEHAGRLYERRPPLRELPSLAWRHYPRAVLAGNLFLDDVLGAIWAVQSLSWGIQTVKRGSEFFRQNTILHKAHITLLTVSGMLAMTRGTLNLTQIGLGFSRTLRRYPMVVAAGKTSVAALRVLGTVSGVTSVAISAIELYRAAALLHFLNNPNFTSCDPVTLAHYEREAALLMPKGTILTNLNNPETIRAAKHACIKSLILNSFSLFQTAISILAPPARGPATLFSFLSKAYTLYGLIEDYRHPINFSIVDHLLNTAISAYLTLEIEDETQKMTAQANLACDFFDQIERSSPFYSNLMNRHPGIKALREQASEMRRQLSLPRMPARRVQRW